MMKNLLKTGLAAVVVGTGCFVAGRWSVADARTAVVPENSALGATTSSRGNALGSGGSSSGNRSEPPPRTQQDARPDKVRKAQTKQPKVARFPVAREVVRGLVGKEMAYKNFSDLQGAMESSLDLMDATEEQKEAVLGATERMREAVLAAERRTTVVKKVTETSILMDLAGMRQPLEDIWATLETDIRAALPPLQAEILLESMDRTYFYRQEEMGEMAFSIERERERGQFLATRRYGANRVGVGVHPSAFKDDGQPLPADKVFGERWAGLLGGRILLPINMPEEKN